MRTTRRLNLNEHYTGHWHRRILPSQQCDNRIHLCIRNGRPSWYCKELLASATYPLEDSWTRASWKTSEDYVSFQFNFRFNLACFSHKLILGAKYTAAWVMATKTLEAYQRMKLPISRESLEVPVEMKDLVFVLLAVYFQEILWLSLQQRLVSFWPFSQRAFIVDAANDAQPLLRLVGRDLKIAQVNSHYLTFLGLL